MRDKALLIIKNVMKKNFLCGKEDIFLEKDYFLIWPHTYQHTWDTPGSMLRHYSHWWCSGESNSHMWRWESNLGSVMYKENVLGFVLSSSENTSYRGKLQRRKIV